MKYRKKPVVIEAIQFTKELALKIWTGKEKPIFGLFSPSGRYFLEKNQVYDAFIIIDTLEGKHQANLGDYIIKGVKGEFYPIKPDIFEMTYEKAE
jgi:hypothetical protein